MPDRRDDICNHIDKEYLREYFDRRFKEIANTRRSKWGRFTTSHDNATCMRSSSYTDIDGNRVVVDILPNGEAGRQRDLEIEGQSMRDAKRIWNNRPGKKPKHSSAPGRLAEEWKDPKYWKSRYNYDPLPQSKSTDRLLIHSELATIPYKSPHAPPRHPNPPRRERRFLRSSQTVRSLSPLALASSGSGSSSASASASGAPNLSTSTPQSFVSFRSSSSGLRNPSGRVPPPEAYISQSASQRFLFTSDGEDDYNSDNEGAVCMKPSGRHAGAPPYYFSAPSATASTSFAATGCCSSATTSIQRNLSLYEPPYEPPEEPKKFQPFEIPNKGPENSEIRLAFSDSKGNYDGEFTPFNIFPTSLSLSSHCDDKSQTTAGTNSHRVSGGPLVLLLLNGTAGVNPSSPPSPSRQQHSHPRPCPQPRPILLPPSPPSHVPPVVHLTCNETIWLGVQAFLESSGVELDPEGYMLSSVRLGDLRAVRRQFDGEGRRVYKGEGEGSEKGMGVKERKMWVTKKWRVGDGEWQDPVAGVLGECERRCELAISEIMSVLRGDNEEIGAAGKMLWSMWEELKRRDRLMSAPFDLPLLPATRRWERTLERVRDGRAREYEELRRRERAEEERLEIEREMERIRLAEARQLAPTWLDPQARLMARIHSTPNESDSNDNLSRIEITNSDDNSDDIDDTPLQPPLFIRAADVPYFQPPPEQQQQQQQQQQPPAPPSFGFGLDIVDRVRNENMQQWWEREQQRREYEQIQLINVPVEEEETSAAPDSNTSTQIPSNTSNTEFGDQLHSERAERVPLRYQVALEYQRQLEEKEEEGKKESEISYGGKELGSLGEYVLQETWEMREEKKRKEEDRLEKEELTRKEESEDVSQMMGGWDYERLERETVAGVLVGWLTCRKEQCKFSLGVTP